MRRVLAIAGSDSGAGAGIQADLKTFAALGVYGLSAISAITAQNTQGIWGIFNMPAEMVALQIQAVVEDIGVDAAKTGMLPTAEIVRVVAEKVREHNLPHLVVDPVFMASSGRELAPHEARKALVEELLPLAEVLTPNLSEAEVLTGLPVKSLADMKKAAMALGQLGPRYIVVKGGHLEQGESVDILFDGQHFREYPGRRIPTRNDHGTGCTFASAIAAGLAKGLTIEEAVAGAKDFVAQALRHSASLTLGRGRGPLQHFGELYRAAGLPVVE